MSATEAIPLAPTPVSPPPAPGSMARADATAPSAVPVRSVRSTRAVLRRVDPWSVLKLSIVYYLAMFVVVLVAVTILWAGASSIGVVENIESFMVDIGFEDFRFVPSKLFAGIALGGLVLVVTGTFANVLMTALFNLMSDVVGGLKVTLQEDVAAPPATKGDGRATI